jgi:hypothetical protein
MYGFRRCSGGIDSGSFPDVLIQEVFWRYGFRRRSLAPQVVGKLAQLEKLKAMIYAAEYGPFITTPLASSNQHYGLVV